MAEYVNESKELLSTSWLFSTYIKPHNPDNVTLHEAGKRKKNIWFFLSSLRFTCVSAERIVHALLGISAAANHQNVKERKTKLENF